MTMLFASMAIMLAQSPLAGPVSVATAGHIYWIPRVSIVWPHDGSGKPASVAQSRAVNVSVWPQNRVHCAGIPDGSTASMTLLVAKDNEPTVPISVTPQLIGRTGNGVAFPTLEYPDVPADLVAESMAQYRFVVYSAGLAVGGGFTSNVWVHAADPRTFLPRPVIPDGHSSQAAPDRVDARIQIVWPHDAQGNFVSADRAPLVNVAVDLFEHGTRKSLPVEPNLYGVGLFVAKRNGPLERATQPPYDARAQRVTYTANGQTFPRWVFNDLRVQPGERYHFVAGALVQGGKRLSRFSTIWTHAPDARTDLPNPEPPPPCAP